jgi:hypothetical protein
VDEDAGNLKCVGCDGGGFGCLDCLDCLDCLGCFGDDVDRIGNSNDGVLAHHHSVGEGGVSVL